VLAFVVSAASAGLGGALFVVVTQLAAPGAFQLPLSIALLAGAVLGGLGSLGGAAIGAFAIVMIPEWSDDVSGALGLNTNIQANLALAIYGAVLIGVMLVAPRGLAGLLRWRPRRPSPRRPRFPVRSTHTTRPQAGEGDTHP
jgi:branched-chain amino acid transport system permease protein